MTTTPTNPSESTRRARRGVAWGVAAGLIGGGAVGIALMAPSLTNAADADVPAALVAQADDTVDDAPPIQRAEPGEKLREILQELVDDGTLTAEQADTVAQHLVENAPKRGEHQGRRAGKRGERRGRVLGQQADALAELFGIDAETLRSELSDGSSLADIADEHGVDVAEVIDLLVNAASDRLDQAVESGRLSAEEAAQKLADLTERVTERVDQAPPAN